MRNIHFFLGVLILSSVCVTNAQSTREIRLVYDRIHKELPAYQMKTAPVFDMSTEGGETTGYYKNNSIQKISTTLLGETGKQIRDYYFNKQQLIFVLETDHHYNAPIYFDQKLADEMGVTEVFDIEKTEIIENRLYLNNDKIFKWLNTQENSETPTPKEVMWKTEDVLNDSRKLLELLHNYKEDEEK